MSLKHLAAPLLLAAVIPTAQAHEVWVERDGNGPARIYLGEPEAPLPEGGDPEFDHLQTPKLLPASHAPLARKAGYIEVAAPTGDVRVHDDAVFAPWGPEGKKQAVVYYARAGRSEARAALPLEIAPATAGGNRFVLTRDGKPVADAAITVISPDKWTKSIKTDAQGGVTVPQLGKGRYLLSASQKDEGEFDTPQGKVAVLHRTTTTTFVWE